MKVINDKKELIDIIGDWSTAHIRGDYVLGSNEITLAYNNEQITFINDDVSYIAFIALQCHLINHKQHSMVLFNEVN